MWLRRASEASIPKSLKNKRNFYVNERRVAASITTIIELIGDL
jgi:hypothetical protein